MYRARNVPEKSEELATFLQQELIEIEQSMQSAAPVLLLQVSHRPPEKLRDGMVVLADGTDWDPGAGAGYYGFRNGTWHHLG